MSNKVVLSMQAFNDETEKVEVFAIKFSSWDEMFQNIVSVMKDMIKKHGYGRVFTKAEITLFHDQLTKVQRFIAKLEEAKEVFGEFTKEERQDVLEELPEGMEFWIDDMLEELHAIPA